VTRRRWIADSWDEWSASLTGEQAAHLVRVLRAQPGMEFDIVAGDRVWHAAVESIADDAVRFTLIAQLEAEPALPITLVLAVFKFDRMEWAIEKATELGVERIVPVIARRTEKHLAQSAHARLDRWRRIAREAAKQSRRSDVPVIEEALQLKVAAQHGRGSTRLLLAEGERETSLRAALATTGRMPGLRIAVGPEGGWTAEEEALFVAEEWTAVSLGPRILRAETAAITAVAVAAALYT
jgi:16S rRNA (uracil1498-N3)-methyltransferase